MLFPDEQPVAVREVMDVRIAGEEGGVSVFRGRLRLAADEAWEKLMQYFSGTGAVLMVQEDEQLGAVIALIPEPSDDCEWHRSCEVARLLN